MKTRVKLIALTLAIMLTMSCLTGCEPLVDAIFGGALGFSELVGDIDIGDYTTGETTFDEMEYTRPDSDDISGLINRLASVAEYADDFETVAECIEKANALVCHYQTMYTLSQIYSDKDITNEYWRDEEKAASEGYYAVSKAYDRFIYLLYESNYKKAIELEYGDWFFCNAEDYIKENENSEIEQLYNDYNDLVSEYEQQLLLGTAEVDGTAMTYTDIAGISDYKAYYDAAEIWLDKYNPILGGIYIDIVKNRNALAREYGYKNFKEQYFAENYFAGYDATQLSRLFDNIADYAAPVYREIGETGYYYMPDINLSFDDCRDFVKTTLRNIDPDIEQTAAVVEKYNLCNYLPSKTKTSSEYTCFLPDYSLPFMMINYTGGEDSLFTYIHELGHCHDKYTNLQTIPASLDTNEVHSQGLELLFANHYDGFFNEDEAYMLRFDTVSSIFCRLVEQTYSAATELEVYSLDDNELTVEKVNEITLSQAKRFDMPGTVGDDYYEMSWVLIPHMFESPFYTGSYITSADVALQIFELSLTNESAAAQAYLAFTERTDSYIFTDCIEAAGLESPFGSGQVADISKLARRLLIDGKWD